MRLDSIREILANNADRLKVASVQMEAGNARLSKIRDVIHAIEAVKLTGMFQKLCQEMLEIHVISLSVHDEIVVSNSTYQRFSALLTELSVRVHYVLDALNEHVKLTPEDCIRVKLPDTSDLAMASGVMQDIDTILNQVVANDHLNGQVRLHGLAEGSHWVDICLGSAGAFQFVAALVRMYFSIKKFQVEQRAREEMLRDVTLQVDLREALAKALVADFDNYVHKQMAELLDQSGVPSTDKEYPLRVENSLRRLGELLEKGLEIHPALSAPMEMRKLLPEPSQLFEVIKKLPSGAADVQKQQ